MPKLTRTHKLGPIVPQPSNSPFNFPRRLPQWHSDVEEGACGEKIHLFLEEGLRRSDGKFEPFPVPSVPKPPPGTSQKKGQIKQAQPEPSYFEEPKDPAGWEQFNKWILGHGLSKIPPTDFDNLLSDLANLVRKYNACLYRLRRLHFYKHSDNKAGDSFPPPGPSEDPKETIDPVGDPAGFDWKVKVAQHDWTVATQNLDQFIDRKPDKSYGGLAITSADMIEVNGYIVSMRIIANPAEPTQPTTEGTVRIREVGGSSSSHISISSAFSSSSP